MDDVERAFREAHGQAVATLVRLFGDLTLAEDAVQDAFVIAMDRWPGDGLPENPAGSPSRSRPITAGRARARPRRSRRGRPPSDRVGVCRARGPSADRCSRWL